MLLPALRVLLAQQVQPARQVALAPQELQNPTLALQALVVQVAMRAVQAVWLIVIILVPVVTVQ